MQFQKEDQSTSSRILYAKTHVAPLKGRTVPKLELCAVFLLAQLIDHVSRILNVNPSSIFAFSDSQVVLSWLAKPPET